MNNSQRVVDCRSEKTLIEVRLNRLYDCLGTPGDALYYSTLSGGYKFLLCNADGELDFEIGSGMPLQDKSPDKMIEAGPQVVDNFPGENGKAEWDRLANRSEDVFLRLMISLSDNSVVVWVNKSGDLGFEILDVLVGPLNLRPTTIKWM